MHLACLLGNEGEIEKSAKYYRHAITIDKENVPARFFFGKLIHNIPKMQSVALECFKFVLEKESEHYKARYYISLIYFENKEIRKAASHLKVCLKVNPRYIPGLVGMGNCFFFSKMYENAIKYYDKAAKLKPSNLQAQLGLANSLFLLKDLKKALEVYKKILEIDNTLEDVKENMLK
jgi:tetratricopeptide (TPR) repeat protein